MKNIKLLTLIFASFLLLAGCANTTQKPVNKLSAQKSLENAATFYDENTPANMTYTHEITDGDTKSAYMNVMIADKNSGITHSTVVNGIYTSGNTVYEQKDDVWYYDNKNGTRDTWYISESTKEWTQISKNTTTNLYDVCNVAKTILDEYKSGNVLPEAEYEKGKIHIKAKLNLPKVLSLEYLSDEKNMDEFYKTDVPWDVELEMVSLTQSPSKATFKRENEVITLVYQNFGGQPDLKMPMFASNIPDIEVVTHTRQ